MALDLAQRIDGAAAYTALDRRRPGRCDDVYPELIPLLRTSGDDVFLAPEDLDDLAQENLDNSDSRAASRGISWAFISAVGVWTLIGLEVWILWSRVF